MSDSNSNSDSPRSSSSSSRSSGEASPGGDLPAGLAAASGLTFHLVLLTLALLLVLPLFAWYGFRAHGTVGVTTAMIAAFVCWVGALPSLFGLALTRGTPAAVQAMLFGMLFRTAIPLGAGFVLQQLGGELARAGVFGMILCYYLWTLLIETLVSVRLVGGAQQTVAKVE